MSDIPISVLVTTKNEEDNIARCLSALKAFAQIIVIDSHSDDRTRDVSQTFGAETILYQWDGRYPKKRQWCLDTLDIHHDWVFWVDADEVVTEACVQEIRALFQAQRSEVGFFVKGQCVWEGTVLRPYVVFLYSYIVKMGFLDGVKGARFALSRKHYCDAIYSKIH